MNISLPLILDGSTGTQLQKRGFTGECSAEEWSIAHPEAVADFQGKYIAAGSDVIYAPTFGANAPVLESHRTFGKVAEFNRKLVAISKEVAAGRALVAGDISPCGRYLYPLGDATFEDLFAVYREQAAALEEAGVELFAIETQSSLADARAAILAVKSVSSKPVFVTFTCDESGKTMMGTDVAAALVVCQSMGADAFGLNCSTGPEAMAAQLRRLREYAEIPLIAKPNAGLPETVDGKTVYNCPPEEFTAFAEEMAALGVGIFGGCCGTGEEHIAALARKVKTLRPAAPAPRHGNELVCATGKSVFCLPADVDVGEAILCDDELEDALDEANEDEERAVLTLELRDEAGVQALADGEYSIQKPVCLRCDDAGLLEKALRVYQGRALYDGSLTDRELLPLAKKYGLIL